jgi:hypothetical protein
MHINGEVEDGLLKQNEEEGQQDFRFFRNAVGPGGSSLQKVFVFLRPNFYRLARGTL